MKKEEGEGEGGLDEEGEGGKGHQLNTRSHDKGEEEGEEKDPEEEYFLMGWERAWTTATAMAAMAFAEITASASATSNGLELEGDTSPRFFYMDSAPVWDGSDLL